MRMKGCGGLPTTAIFSAFTVLVFCVWTDIPVTPRPLALRKDAVGSKQLSVCTLATSRLPSTSYSWISINRARIRVIMKVHKKQPFQGPLSKQVSESWGKHVEARIQWACPRTSEIRFLCCNAFTMAEEMAARTRQSCVMAVDASTEVNSFLFRVRSHR